MFTAFVELLLICIHPRFSSFSSNSFYLRSVLTPCNGRLLKYSVCLKREVYNLFCLCNDVSWFCVRFMIYSFQGLLLLKYSNLDFVFSACAVALCNAISLRFLFCFMTLRLKVTARDCDENVFDYIRELL